MPSHPGAIEGITPAVIENKVRQAIDGNTIRNNGPATATACDPHSQLGPFPQQIVIAIRQR